MRIALTTGRLALLGALVLGALVATLPLRLALQWFGGDQFALTARTATGPVWCGMLREAQLSGVALGDIAAGLSPLDLLLGRARLWLQSGDVDGLHGSLIVSRHSFGFAGLSGAIVTGERLGRLPITRVEATNLTIRFVDGICDRAEGEVRVMLDTTTPGLPLPAAMSGPVRCAGTAVSVRLTAPSGGSSVDLRVEQSGRYTATLRLPTPLAPVPAGATSSLRPGPSGLVLPVTGRF